MRHLDLFSGIGGFAIAASQVWPDHELVTFCEIDPFCQKVLKKNFPNVPIHGDIKKLKANNFGRIDLLTGGFPCQPFSQAGKQRGKEDDRFLWPEMLRIIREAKPTWIIGENVAGIINMALEQVCVDLENEGYEVQPFVVPACAVNAPHRRDRVWIIGHARSPESGGVSSFKGSQISKARCSGKDAPNPTNSGGEGQHARQREAQFRRSDWEQDWLPLATEICRVDDGLPVELDGFKLTKSQHRAERLKSLGNAIVPEVAIEIMEAILSLKNAQ